VEEGPKPSTQKTVHKNRLLKILAVFIAIAGLVIVLYPFFPQIKYWFSSKEVYPYPTQLKGDYEVQLPTVDNKNATVNENQPLVNQTEQEQKPTTKPKSKTASLPKDNRLVIPKIGVNAKIVEGSSENVMYKGVWHIPSTSSPDKEGNTVISGHRFQYRPPNNTTFYLLDKLGKGDYLIVYWQGKEYDYRVTKTMVVGPKESSLLENTTKPILSLFTCTPLFTTKQRLFVIGELINK
jgi:sortase A